MAWRQHDGADADAEDRSSSSKQQRVELEATFVIPFDREHVFTELTRYGRPLGVPTAGPGAVRFQVPPDVSYAPTDDEPWQVGWQRLAHFTNGACRPEGYVTNECIELIPNRCVKWKQISSQKKGMSLVGAPKLAMKFADTPEGGTWCWIKMEPTFVSNWGKPGEHLERNFALARQKAWADGMERRGYPPFPIGDKDLHYEPRVKPLTGVCYCGAVTVSRIRRLPPCVFTCLVVVGVRTPAHTLREAPPRHVPRQIVALGEPNVMCMCHCNACRSWTGGISQAIVMYASDDVEITGELNQTMVPYRGGYPDSNKVGVMPKGFSRRKSCKRCHACVINDHSDTGQLIDICGGLLDFEPGGFLPTMHVNYGSRIIDMSDGLAKFKDVPSEFGGTGEIIPETAERETLGLAHVHI
eukprot:1217764-Prymnesium_polylepis.1